MPATKTAGLGDTFLTSIKQAQDLAADGVKTWVDFAGKTLSAPGFEGLPGFQMPGTKEFVDAGFGFVEELVAAQKELAYKLLDLVDAKSAA